MGIVASIAMVGIGGGASSVGSGYGGGVVAGVDTPSAAAAAATSTSGIVGFIVHSIIVEGVGRTGVVGGGRRRRRRRRTSPTELIGRHGHALLSVCIFYIFFVCCLIALAAVCLSPKDQIGMICNRGSNEQHNLRERFGRIRSFGHLPSTF